MISYIIAKQQLDRGEISRAASCGGSHPVSGVPWPRPAAGLAVAALQGQ